MSLPLNAILSALSSRVGASLARYMVDGLLSILDRLRGRVADAADSMEDEEALDAWFDAVDDALDFRDGSVAEWASDMLIDAVRRAAAELWQEAQEAAVRAEMRAALREGRPDMSPTVEAALARRERPTRRRMRRPPFRREIVSRPAVRLTPAEPAPEPVPAPSEEPSPADPSQPVTGGA